MNNQHFCRYYRVNMFHLFCFLLCFHYDWFYELDTTQVVTICIYPTSPFKCIKTSKRRLLKWFDDNDDYNKDYTNSKWLKNPDFQRDFELELIWWLYIVDICHVIGRIDIKKKKNQIATLYYHVSTEYFSYSLTYLH